MTPTRIAAARQMAEALERVRGLLETSSPLEPFFSGLACRHICEDAIAAWSAAEKEPDEDQA